MRALLTFCLFALLSCEPPRVMAPTTGTDLPPYVRDEWGQWIDADKNCRDTRQEVLIAESLVPVTLDERGCRVLTGRWKCPYTGVESTDPRAFDIDHAVSLHEAHDSGGYLWDKARKQAFFNDLSHPYNLVAVSLSTNRSKGDKPPQEWLPPLESARCQYLQAWVKTKRDWGLDVDCDEAKALASLIAQYCP